MREKTIEQKLVKATKAVGGIALKLTCPGWGGVPDRLILLPGKRSIPIYGIQRVYLRSE